MKLTMLKFMSGIGYAGKFVKVPIYIQEQMISEIYPIAVWPTYKFKDSDIGAGSEDEGVHSIVVMSNGNILRIVESPEQILGIE